MNTCNRGKTLMIMVSFSQNYCAPRTPRHIKYNIKLNDDLLHKIYIMVIYCVYFA